MLVGASWIHRRAGLGFALVATPITILLLGVNDALLLVSIAATLSALITLIVTWKSVRLAQSLPLSIISLVSASVVIVLSRSFAAGLPEIIAGILAVLIVLFSIFPVKAVSWSMRSVAAAGIATGLMVGLAGMGGPTALAHAQQRNWKDALVPNLQVIFLGGSLANIGLRWQTVEVDPFLMISAGLAVVIGTILGELSRAFFAGFFQMRVLFAIAFIGGLGAIVRGVWELLG